MQPRLLKINNLGDKVWEKGYLISTYMILETHFDITNEMDLYYREF